MTVNAVNARIFGGDNDSISLAPVGTPLPTSINDTLNPAFEDVGWLGEDGINESFTGSKKELRGHQGARVVRTRMETPGTTIGFLALESKAQTKKLRYDEKSASVTSGVRKTSRTPGQKVQRRAAVVDVFDADDSTVKERWVFPVVEITSDGDRVFVNNDIAGFPFMANVIADYDTHESLITPAAAGWNVTVSGSPTGGTYALIVNGVSTAAIAYNANAAAVAAAVNALAGVTGVTGVSGTGTSPIVLTFPSPVTLAATSALTGGTTPTVTVAAV